MRIVLVIVQAVSFFGLGALLVHQGNWKLGVAQLLLGVVTALVYA